MHPVLTGVLVAPVRGFLLGMGLVIRYKGRGRIYVLLRLWL
jgi:hypothetical protein